jgi:CubicO group peptidase (beta-lactamase class C family)
MPMIGLTLFAQLAAPAWAGQLDSLVLSELARTRTPGVQVAVVVDGRLAYSKGYGVADIETGRPVTDRTLFRVGSVTKMVTGTLIAQLAAEGKLDPQSPIARYVTELEGKRVGRVTTHQLLTHSAGWLDNAIPYGRTGEGALGEVMREVGDTLFFTEPGRVYSYSNPGYSMSGYVAERAGGARFASQIEPKVLRALAMPRATFKPLEALTHDFSQGHFGQGASGPTIVRPFTENTAQWAAGFLMVSAGELANLAIALMDGGRFEGKQVLAADAVTRITTGYVKTPNDTTSRYGYGLNIGRSGAERVWRHGGSINGFDASLAMFPDRKLAVLVFDNLSGAPLMGITDFVALRVAGISPATPPVLPAQREASATERAQLVGTYKMGPTTVEIVESNGALRLLQRPNPEVEVRLVGTDRLVALLPTGGRPTLFLVRGTDGRVEYLHQGGRSLARQP